MSAAPEPKHPLLQPLVIARLKGGLGNQIAHYAAARLMSLRFDLPLRLDLSEFARDLSWRTPRTYALGPFATIQHSADPDLVRRLTGTLGGRAAGRVHRTMAQKGFRPRGPVLVTLPWYGERSAPGAEQLRAELVLTGELSPAAREIARAIAGAAHPVAVHVRRGDYVGHSRHQLCDEPYFDEAIRYCESRIAEPELFVFSEDVEWCRERLRFRRARFVQGVGSDAEEFILMARCRHFILSNSTFSWWALWLQRDPGVVVAPERWDREATGPSPFLRPGWHVLPVE
ncbi:MAG TPA: alpha-1,2-fucosyltransferase [Thermoanaerobaculia bacterium]|nr:alpha-1,2-fucosyltransferase [Thermoanaerobaculia bacterium]